MIDFRTGERRVEILLYVEDEDEDAGDRVRQKERIMKWQPNGCERGCEFTGRRGTRRSCPAGESQALPKELVGTAAFHLHSCSSYQGMRGYSRQSARGISYRRMGVASGGESSRSGCPSRL